MKKFKKILSLTLAFALCLSVAVPAFATDTPFLSIDLGDGFVVHTEYPSSDFSVKKSIRDGWYVADVQDSMGNTVESFALEMSEANQARATGTIQRAFTNTRYETVSNTGNVRTICGITNEVLLEIYVSGSFKQIESVISNRVYAADGEAQFTVTGTTCNALPPNGYPATYVNCYYSGTCSVKTSNDVAVEGEVSIKVSDLTNIGFKLGWTHGSEKYYNKTISRSWSISV